MAVGIPVMKMYNHYRVPHGARYRGTSGVINLPSSWSIEQWSMIHTLFIVLPITGRPFIDRLSFPSGRVLFLLLLLILIFCYRSHCSRGKQV